MIVKYNFVIVGKNFVMVWGQAPGGYLGPLSEGAVCPMDRLGECAANRSRELDALSEGFPWRGSCRNFRCD